MEEAKRIVIGKDQFDCYDMLKLKPFFAAFKLSGYRGKEQNWILFCWTVLLKQKAVDWNIDDKTKVGSFWSFANRYS